MEQLLEWELAKETKVLWENLRQSHFVQKPHMIWPGMGGKMETNHPSYGTAITFSDNLVMYS